MKLTATFFGLLLFTLAENPSNLYGKAAYYLKADMIKRSDIIALVTITSVQSANVKGAYWTYGEVATAKVNKVLKGELPSEVRLYGGEDFICAQCHYVEGKFLVFLKRDREFLTGVNWHLSIRPVNGDIIEWYKNDASLELESKSLNQVLSEVEAFVSENKTIDNKSVE